MRKLIIILWVLVTGSALVVGSENGAYAQKVSDQSMLEIRGRVVDSEGYPLPGVGVFDGSGAGAVTDLDGRYSIYTKKGSTLQFSFLGYTTRSVKAINEADIDIVLKEDKNLLEEVVVVGYGTQARKTLTTSISKVDGESINGAPVTSIGDAIKGKVPGLTITTSNSLSGESPRFMIRGGSSITMGNDPIYLVDGSIRADLNGVNPNDIESIEVLKDAASAGIYGARASNGIILVTTKKGAPSKGPQITFDIQMGFQQPSTRWNILNSREYLSFIRPAIATAMANDSAHPANAMLTGANAYGTGNTSSKGYYSTRYLEWGGTVPQGWQWMLDPLDETKVLIFQDNDWQDDWFSTAFWQKEYLGINGGNDRMKYAASASYTGDDGVISMSDYKVFTMHGATSFKITNNLEASTIFDMSRQAKSIPVDNYYQCYGRGIIAAPTAMEKNLDGEWCQTGPNAHSHSAAWYEAFYKRGNTTSRMSGTINLKWTIIDGLVANAQYNYFEQNYNGSYRVLGEVDGITNSVSATRAMTETRSSMLRNTANAHINFNRSFAAQHHVSATAGFEWMDQYARSLTSKSSGAVSDDVPVLQSGINFESSNKNEKQAMMSWFGRVGYDYGHRYIAAATFRADASSKFAKGNRWGYFPSGSLAWVISEEPFWKSLSDKANTFKIRASYGLTGNNGIGLYDTYGSFSIGSYGTLSTLIPSKMQNSGMKWETTSQLDLGIDLGFLNNRIRLVADYYNKVTDNMLFSITLPDTSPYGSVKANVGSARFYGFEAEIHTENIRTRNFSWSTDLTYAYNQNRVLSLPDEYKYDIMDEYGRPTGKTGWRIGGYTMSDTGYRFGGTAVGEPLGRIYGYKVDHIIQTEAEAAAAYYDPEAKGFRVSDGNRSTGRKDAGDYEWCNRLGSAKDENGNEIINSEDMFYLGNVTPHSVGGLNNSFRFKGLTLNVYFDYALGHSIINGQKTQLLKNTMGDCNSMIGDLVYDCWSHPYDSDAKYARYTPNDTDWGNRNWRSPSSFNVEKANYLCLREVSLYYELPEKWTNAVKMKKVILGVSGNTLCYLTGVTGGISPESGISSASGSNMYQAVSTNNSDSDVTGNLMPPARKVIFSIKMTF